MSGNSGSKPNYPSTFQPLSKPKIYAPTQENWSGHATNFQFDVTDEDYVQATGLWEVLGRTPGQQDNFVYNVASHLNAADKIVRERTYAMFSKVDKVLGKRIAQATEDAAASVV